MHEPNSITIDKINPQEKKWHQNIVFYLCSLCQFLTAAVIKYHKLGSLKQQKSVLSQFWRLEVGNQGIGRVCSYQSSEGEYVPCLSLSFWCFWQSLAFLDLWHHSPSFSLHRHMAFFLCFFTSSSLNAYSVSSPLLIRTLSY